MTKLSRRKLKEIDLTIRFCHLIHTIRMEHNLATEDAFQQACETLELAPEDGQALLKLLNLEVHEIIQELGKSKH